MDNKRIVSLIKEMAREQNLRTMNFLINESTLKSGTKGSDSRSIGHFIKYVAPYLSPSGLEMSRVNILSTADNKDANLNLSNSQKEKIKALVPGEKRGGSHETTDGRKVQISHIEIINGSMHGVTHTGERILFSRLKKPKEFETSNTTKGAFEIENKLAGNLGGVPAGPNRNALADVHAMVGGKEVKMESKSVERSLPKFGQISIKHTEEGWHFLGHDDLVEAAKKATVNGVHILDHLNKNHPEGIIGRNVRASTENTGATGAYFKANGANVLHLHGKNGGSTFTVGGDEKDHPFKNTGLRHLSSEHLRRLDGSLVIDSRGSVIFRPNGKNLRSLRDSASRGETRDLHNAGHAKSWIERVKSQ